MAIKSSNGSKNVIELLVVASGSLRQGNVVFRYPTNEDGDSHDAPDNIFGVKIVEDFRAISRNFVRVTGDQLNGCTNEALASMLSPQEAFCGRPFKLQINSTIFVGYPIKVDTFGNSLVVNSSTPLVIRTVNVVFAVRCNSPPSVLDSFCDLARQICVAIVSEEIRCKYLSSRFPGITVFNRMSAESENGAEHLDGTYHSKEEEFHKNLVKIFDSAREAGIVNHHFNDLIHISWIMGHTGSITLKPWFSILMLATEETIICGSLPDLTYLFFKFMNCVNPMKTIAEIASDMCSPIEDVYYIIRHLHAWKKCVIFYPLAQSNFYGIQGSMTRADEDKFAMDFSGNSLTLSSVLAFFSPIVRLAEFLEFIGDDSNKCTNIVMWLIKNKLLVQYHQFVYVTDTELFNMAKDSSKFAEVTQRLASIGAGSSTKEEREIVAKLLPYFDGSHSIDEVVFQEHEIPRNKILYIIDKFASIFTSSYQPDPIIVEQFR